MNSENSLERTMSDLSLSSSGSDSDQSNDHSSNISGAFSSLLSAALLALNNSRSSSGIALDSPESEGSNFWRVRRSFVPLNDLQETPTNSDDPGQSQQTPEEPELQQGPLSPASFAIGSDSDSESDSEDMDDWHVRVSRESMSTFEDFEVNNNSTENRGQEPEPVAGSSRARLSDQPSFWGVPVSMSRLPDSEDSDDSSVDEEVFFESIRYSEVTHIDDSTFGWLRPFQSYFEDRNGNMQAEDIEE